MTDERNATTDQQRASRRVADLLRRGIDAGQYAPGAQLPSYRQLAAEHHVAVNTAQVAVRLLATDGHVTIRPGSGAFVLGARSDAAKAHSGVDRGDLTKLREQLRKAGRLLSDVERALVEMIDRVPPAEAKSAGEVGR